MEQIKFFSNERCLQFINFAKKKMGNITFMMIKPDAVENGYIGKIIEKVTSAGFSFKSLKLTQLSKKNAEQFYKIHKDQPFYVNL